MKWFGKNWGSDFCNEFSQSSVPDLASYKCRCGRGFKSDENGILMPESGSTYAPFHLDCFSSYLGIRIVHILQSGRSICGMPGIPSQWPGNHRWVRSEDSSESTCVKCREIAHLGPKTRPVTPYISVSPVQPNGTKAHSPKGSVLHWKTLRSGFASSACGVIRGGSDSNFSSDPSGVTCSRCTRTAEFSHRNRTEIHSSS